MEYRKLISFGKSSFVVSLPKSWIKGNNIKKGDLIYINERENNLILSSKEFDESEEKEITISIDKKDSSRVRRELNAAYIENNRKITFKGKELKERSQDLLNDIRDLIALEVLEFDSHSIVTKDFLDMDKISPQELLRKIDMIIRSMLKDCVANFKDDNYTTISLRDKDVNRLSFLLFRIIRYGMRNQGKMLKNHNLKTQDLLNMYLATFQLEGVADEAKRISRGMKNAESLSDKDKKAFVEMIKESEEFYLRVVKAYFGKNREEALELSDLERKVINKVNKFYESHHKKGEIAYMIDHLRRLIGLIHEFNRLSYQY